MDLAKKLLAQVTNFHLTESVQNLTILGVTINALWPATMVESFATINHKLGEASLWRKASIIAESTLGIVTEPKDFTARALIDEVRIE